MATISKLVVELTLAANDFNNQIRSAQKEARELEKTIKPTKEAAVQLGTAMAAAGTLVVGSMLAMTKSAADYGESLKNASQKTGVSVENMAKWGFAAEQNESSMEALSTGLKFLAKNTEAAIDKTGIQRDAFAALGITARDLEKNHGDLNKLLPVIADRMKNIKDPAEKAALMMQIFGKAGVDLIPVMDLGSKGLLDFGKRAEDLHVVMSGKNAEDFDTLGDTAKEVETAFKGLSVQVGTALAPALTVMSGIIRDSVANLAQFVKDNQGLAIALAAVGTALAVGGTLMVGVAGMLIALPSMSAGFTLVTGSAFTATTALVAFKAIMTALPIVALVAELVVMAKLLYDIKSATDSAKTANAQADKGLTTNIANLKKLGIEYSTAGKSIELQERQVAALTREYWQNHTPAVKSAGDQHKATKEEIKAMADKAKEAEERISKLADIMIFARTKSKDFADNAISDMDRYWNNLNNRTSDSLQKIATTAEQGAKHFNGLIGELDAFDVKMKAEGVDFAVDTAAVFKNERDKAAAYSKDAAGMVVADLKKAKTDHDSAAQDVADVWKTATGNITSGFAEAFTDALFHGGNFFTSMKNLAVSTAESMLQAFLAGLLSPLTTALGKLGSQLAGIISGAPGEGDDEGGEAGGALDLGGLIGGAGSKITGGLGAAGKFLWSNPWTIAAGAGLAGVTAWIKSQAHHEANTIVKNIENPFWEAWGQILPTDQVDQLAAMAPGKAQSILSELSVMNSNYLGLVDQFSKGGSDEALVSRQSLANTQPHFKRIAEALQRAISAGSSAGADSTGSSAVTPPETLDEWNRRLSAGVPLPTTVTTRSNTPGGDYALRTQVVAGILTTSNTPGGGLATKTQVTVNISAMDASGIERIVKDKIIPAINRAVEYGSTRLVSSEVTT